MAASRVSFAGLLAVGLILPAAMPGAIMGSLPGHAADIASLSETDVPDTTAGDGVPCALKGFSLTETNASMLPWDDVWYGHFSGGRPSGVQDVIGREVIDWRDEHLCFPSKTSCDAYMTKMRRSYHRPEGYWTCLVLR